MPVKNKKHKKARSPGSMGGAFSYIGLPADADCRTPVTSVTGNRFVKVEHHRGILLFTDRCVKLCSANGMITVKGRELAAARMDGDEVMLEGVIESVSFE